MTKSAVSYLLRANINNTAWFDVPIIIKNRSSRPKMSCKKGVLKSFAKFTGKHLYQSLFFNKVVGLRFATLLKKRFWHRCFLVNFAKFLRTPFLHNTSWRLLLHLAKNTYWSILFCSKWFSTTYKSWDNFRYLYGNQDNDIGKLSSAGFILLVFLFLFQWCK